MYICNQANSEWCRQLGGCPHAIPHEPKIVILDCTLDDNCFDENDNYIEVKCVKIEKEEI